MRQELSVASALDLYYKVGVNNSAGMKKMKNTDGVIRSDNGPLATITPSLRRGVCVPDSEQRSYWTSLSF